MLLYIMLYIVLAYLMLFAALTNSVCLNNASLFSFSFYNIFYQRAMSSPEKSHLKITIIIIIINLEEKYYVRCLTQRPMQNFPIITCNVLPV